jgi:hypothetical protein
MRLFDLEGENTMGIDERSRHDLHVGLEEILGPDRAAILMEHLPPMGWADVATKRDLDQVAAATRRDLDQVTAAAKYELLATFRAEMNAQTRTLFFAIAGLNLTTVGLVFAAARLT